MGIPEIWFFIMLSFSSSNIAYLIDDINGTKPTCSSKIRERCRPRNLSCFFLQKQAWSRGAKIFKISPHVLNIIIPTDKSDVQPTQVRTLFF